MSSVTFDQARAFWKARMLGQRVRDICAEHDVDPRRLYEVWTEAVHSGSRTAAYEELKAETPSLAPEALPLPHTPRFKVIPLEDEGQLTFMDELMGEVPTAID